MIRKGKLLTQIRRYLIQDIWNFWKLRIFLIDSFPVFVLETFQNIEKVRGKNKEDYEDTWFHFDKNVEWLDLSQIWYNYTYEFIICRLNKLRSFPIIQLRSFVSRQSFENSLVQKLIYQLSISCQSLRTFFIVWSESHFDAKMHWQYLSVLTSRLSKDLDNYNDQKFWLLKIYDMIYLSIFKKM